MVHGPPRVLQHDQVREFKGAVRRLMESLQVRIIESSPYHPQSQGKVERTNRVLRKKIMYDLVTCQRKGVNWVKHLPSYSRGLNDMHSLTILWKLRGKAYFMGVNQTKKMPNEMLPWMNAKMLQLTKNITISWMNPVTALWMNPITIPWINPMMIPPLKPLIPLMSAMMLHSM